jgi:glucose-1-phosphate cytidylyltransferase
LKAIILAGGLGSRLSEETDIKPKPMVEIGGRPIIWHIMKIYASHGITDFIICLGYKGYVIKEYFANYFLHSADVVFDLKENQMEVLSHSSEPWRVWLIDTGMNTMTGGRIKRALNFIDEDETFCVTYGDGLSNVDINACIELHKKEKRLATVTAVQQPGRFGSVLISDNKVMDFCEKPHGDGAWINGGFFVMSPGISKYIDDDSSIWEREPMEKLATNNELSAYMHKGFWQPMDTLREKNLLESLWQSGDAPWKLWK